MHNTIYSPTLSCPSEENGDHHTAPSTPTSDKTKEQWCRICLEEDDLDNLLAPCKCSGTLKYVHQSCQKEWKKWRSKKYKRRCEICKARFDKVDHTITQSLFYIMAIQTVVMSFGFSLKFQSAIWNSILMCIFSP